MRRHSPVPTPPRSGPVRIVKGREARGRHSRHASGFALANQAVKIDPGSAAIRRAEPDRPRREAIPVGTARSHLRPAAQLPLVVAGDRSPRPRARGSPRIRGRGPGFLLLNCSIATPDRSVRRHVGAGRRRRPARRRGGARARHSAHGHDAHAKERSYLRDFATPEAEGALRAPVRPRPVDVFEASTITPGNTVEVHLHGPGPNPLAAVRAGRRLRNARTPCCSRFVGRRGFRSAWWHTSQVVRFHHDDVMPGFTPARCRGTTGPRPDDESLTSSTTSSVRATGPAAARRPRASPRSMRAGTPRTIASRVAEAARQGHRLVFTDHRANGFSHDIRLRRGHASSLPESTRC